MITELVALPATFPPTTYTLPCHDTAAQLLRGAGSSDATVHAFDDGSYSSIDESVESELVDA